MESGVYVLPPSQDAGPSRRLTRRSQVRPATIFVPQDRTLSPEEHFPLQTISAPGRLPFPRFINRFDSREILLVIDGSCVNNGRHANPEQDPVGGCSFIFKGSSSSSSPPSSTRQPVAGSVAFRLERRGPRGDAAPHTSNRAKLRAVIAALQFRAWAGEGWRRVVVLTDLEYIVWGATRWLPRWVARRWRKPPSSPSSSSSRRGNGGGWRGYGCRGCYRNRDLWEELQARIEELWAHGCEVSFWLVRGVGQGGRGGGDGVIARAKEAARRAARSGPAEEVEMFTKLCGIMV
ncbi:605985cb-d4ee-4da0-81cb-a9ad04e6471e [Thermothielavioides terrestris]|uniref:605985cb-d4ee-4da0-81cb-a9ad04e6471e n=1 Tax=Thermothielavioides terrestris TaxID=2587410 RepID=A0A3S4AZ07_9PEZI|nr:605985cb-d4ee-4da0-81cb-a9ad04e6471e [Thermothielavioides terrestris]